MSTATDIIDAAQGYATTSIQAGVNAMNAASAALGSLGKSISTDPFKGVNLVIQPPAPGDPGDVPDYTGIHMNPDDLDSLVGLSPVLGTVGDLVLPNDPNAPPADLVFVDPPYPTGVNPDYTLLSGVPAIEDLPPLPVMPNLQGELAGIVAPALIEIDIPDAPVYVAPEFTGTPPVFDATPPQDLDLQLRNAYGTISPVFQAAVAEQFDSFMDSRFPGFAAGMAAIEDRLATYLAGGSALSPEVENAMQGRARDRANTEYRRAAAKATKDAARLGMTVIGPTLTSQLLDIDQARRDSNVKVAIDIFVKQAELEQSNLQFAVSKSIELRKVALDAAISYYQGMVTINSQALEFARTTVDSIVKAFDVAARYAETQARIYEADATVYRARLEGALATIHAYEATIQGLQAKAALNRDQVEAYTARLNAVRVEADVYRASVDAVLSAAQLERTKVELYSSKVAAFTAQVNGFTAQWNSYDAAIRGQAARMEVNVAHSREYEAAANAYNAIVNARAKAIDSQIQTNNQKVTLYRTKVEAFAALERAKVDAVQIDVAQYKAQLDAFVAKAQAISEKSRAEVANYDVALRGLIAQSNVILEQLKEFNHLDIVRATGLAQVAETIGVQYARLAESAMSGMNSLGADINNTSA